MTRESGAQARVRLAAAREPGVTLWRNNVGVLLDATGRPVRYGLANDSAQLNARLKSADLIGWRTVTVTPDMVGQRVAIFLSREVKAPGWRGPRLTDPREAAQDAWRRLVHDAGGDAAFTTGEESV